MLALLCAALISQFSILVARCSVSSQEFFKTILEQKKPPKEVRWDRKKEDRGRIVKKMASHILEIIVHKATGLKDVAWFGMNQDPYVSARAMPSEKEVMSI